MVVFIFAVASIVGVASMLPGGIGSAEAFLAAQFIAIAGLTSGPAAALTIVIRLATLWFAIVLGIVGLLALRFLLGKVQKRPRLISPWAMGSANGASGTPAVGAGRQSISVYLCYNLDQYATNNL